MGREMRGDRRFSSVTRGCLCPIAAHCGTPPSASQSRQDGQVSDQHSALRSELLEDATHDYNPLWEAWSAANSRFPTLSLSQRLALAEDVIRDLLANGLIKLYRGPWTGSDKVQVPTEEEDHVLRRWDSWIAGQDPLIWFTSTEQGNHAARLID